MEAPRPQVESAASLAAADERVRALVRPHANLFKLYVIYSLAALFAFPIAFVPLYFRFHTLRYRFDEEGVGAQWGILFRREIYLSYKRIQDIHVKRNVFERWLGIGTVEVQTASGSAGAELKLEGLEDYDGVRDYLYRLMRGHEQAAPPAAEGASAPPAGEGSDALALLRSIRDELAAAREALERSS